MGLTMGQKKAVTKAIAKRCKRASKADKSKILDGLWPRRAGIATTPVRPLWGL